MYQEQNGNHKQQDNGDDKERKKQKRQKRKRDSLLEILGEDDEDYKFYIEYMKNEPE
eukprot:jgi/Psemu1/311995/fgenesh1_kg.865_\